MNAGLEVPLPAARPSRDAILALLELTKPRVALASVLTALAGYATATGPATTGSWWLLTAGAGLTAGGTLTFNQWWERDTDPRMRRTHRRPLVRGAIRPGVALAWSLVLTCAGLVLLTVSFPFSATLVATAIWFLYGLVYTPMKRRSRWATEIGALSGALPPLLGSAAAGDIASPHALVLAAILLFWQMPHFYAIGWIYRADYRAAGLPLLPAIDSDDGARTGAWSLGYSVPLATCLVAPWPFGWTGPAFGLSGTLAAVALSVAAFRFWRAKGTRELEARFLFRTTLLVLPPLLIVASFPRR